MLVGVKMVVMIVMVVGGGGGGLPKVRAAGLK